MDVKKIHTEYLLESHELRKLGIENGSAAVKGAFILIVGVFLVNALFAYLGKELFGPAYLLGLSGIVSFALIAYFGFIFKYTVSAKVNVKEGADKRFKQGAATVATMSHVAVWVLC